VFQRPVPTRLRPPPDQPGRDPDNFSDGWNVASIEAVGLEVNFSPEPVPAWLATIERRVSIE